MVRLLEVLPDLGGLSASINRRSFLKARKLFNLIAVGISLKLTRLLGLTARVHYTRDIHHLFVEYPQILSVTVLLINFEPHCRPRIEGNLSTNSTIASKTASQECCCSKI